MCGEEEEAMMGDGAEAFGRLEERLDLEMVGLEGEGEQEAKGSWSWTTRRFLERVWERWRREEEEWMAAWRARWDGFRRRRLDVLGWTGSRGPITLLLRGETRRLGCGGRAGEAGCRPWSSISASEAGGEGGRGISWAASWPLLGWPESLISLLDGEARVIIRDDVIFLLLVGLSRLQIVIGPPGSSNGECGEIQEKQESSCRSEDWDICFGRIRERERENEFEWVCKCGSGVWRKGMFVCLFVCWEWDGR
jgi:hypothetical protein